MKQRNISAFILDTTALHSVHMSPVVFLDHKTAGLVLGFPLLFCMEAVMKHLGLSFYAK